MPLTFRNSLATARRLASIGVFVLVACPMAEALDPRKSIGQFIHQTWQTEGGLPDSSVTAILQNRDGYLLFGTHRGIVRFDGVRFTVFDRRNTPSIQADSIDALCEDRTGTLWVGTANGLHRFEGGRLGPFSQGTTIASSPVQAIVEAPTGGIWFGTADGGASFVRDGVTTNLSTAEGLSSGKVRALAIDREGSVWIGTFGGGLNRYRDGRVTVFTTTDGLASNNVQTIYQDREGALWVGTDGGLSSFRNGRFTSLTTRDGLSDNSVRAVMEDRDGCLWIATFGGLNRYLLGKFSSFTSKTGLSNDVVLAIFEDREGSLWIGTEGGGMNRLKDGMLTAYTTADGLSNDLICPILEDRDRNLWIGTYGGGLNRMKDGVVTAFTTRDGLSSNNLNSLYQDRRNVLWIGTIGGGINRLDGNRFTAFTERDGLSNDSIHAITEDAAGVLWIGTERGVTKHADGRFSTFTTRDGLSGDTIRVLLPDEDGSMWVGTSEGLNHVTPNGVTIYRKADGLPADIVWSLYRDAAGTLWVGTAGGLARLDNGRIASATTDEGLFDNDIYQILEDDFENLWMSCTKGIFRVAKRQIVDVMNGTTPRLTCESYGRADGMRSEVCTHYFQPAGWKAADGRLWFPTTKGAVVVDTARFVANAVPPPVIIEDVIVDSESLDLMNVADLGPGKERFEFHFTGLSFFAPETIRFRYRLEGFDDDWVDAGTQRVAYFTNLPACEYTFHVIASVDGGAWTETAASYRFRYRPSAWLTWWAMLLYAGAGVGLVYAGVRLRVRALEHRNRTLEARIAERTTQLAEKVQEVTVSEERAHASELRALEASRAKSTFLSNISHELRTPLTSILGFVQLIARDATLPETQRNRLAIVLKSGEHLHALIDDVLSLSKIEAGRMTLNEKAYDLFQLLQSLEDMLRVRVKRSDVALVFDRDDSVPGYVVGDEGKLRQILINLLGNAVKFTEKGHVTLRVRWHEGRATFEVEDTGPGIEAEELETLFETFVQSDSGRRTKEGTGLGLAICRNFVRMMGGDIDVSSDVGTGSTFRFEIDLPEATAVEAEVHVPPALRLAPGQETFRILVVDDDAETRALFGDLLRSAGYEVHEARDGKLGVEQWLELQPHLVCMDIRMPVMDGYAATRRIRELEGGRKRTIVIALSASAFKHERDASLQAGCDDFVSKPYHDADVIERIGSHLGAVYEVDDSFDGDARSPMVVTTQRLALLDPEIRARLKEAAVHGSVQSTMKSIAEIRMQDVALADELAEIVANLELAELLALVERAETRRPV